MHRRGTSGNNDAIEFMFYNIVSDNLLPRVGTGVFVGASYSYVRQCPCIFGNGRYINNSRDIDTAVTNINSGAYFAVYESLLKAYRACAINSLISKTEKPSGRA